MQYRRVQIDPKTALPAFRRVDGQYYTAVRVIEKKLLLCFAPDGT